VSELSMVQIAGVTFTGRSSVMHSKRRLAGLFGIFLAAMMAGLNNRVGALALVDVRGALGFGFDDASWIVTMYNAGELIAMPFAAWFAITLSVRRFELWVIGICTLLAVLLPGVHSLKLLLILRFLQGIAAGAMIPVLMMAALKFLPPPIRLHGLALYAMTATFAPNLAFWLSGLWTDSLLDWRWVYWQVVSLATISWLLVLWGLPREHVQMERFRQMNFPALVSGVPGLGLITVALNQGTRLDWFNSALVTTSLMMGLILLLIYLIVEWNHPSPFIKLQILARRNLWLGFILFVCLLIILMSNSLLPAGFLGSVQGYRPLQMAPIGLIVALPQLVLGFAVALLLYQKRMDGRVVFAAGLFLVALACFCGTQLTSGWHRDQFVIAQTLQAIGQPMAVVSMLFLATSVVRPDEGPYVSGSINTLRAMGSLLGVAIVGQFVTVRGRFHTEMLLDHAGLVSNPLPFLLEPAQLNSIISEQSLVLSIVDAYYVLGIFALLLIPLVSRLTYIPAPDLPVAPDSVSDTSSRG